MRGVSRLVAAVLLPALLAGCALPIQAEMEQVSDVAGYARRYDHEMDVRTNLLDRALGDCPEKTLAAERVCVRRAVDAASSIGTLVALVPRCRVGTICRYEHATRDRLGFVRASATDFVKRWRIDLDFRRSAADPSHVPATVTDLDDFEAPSAPPAPG